MERPFKQLSVYALAELISQHNDQLVQLDRLRNQMQVVTFAGTILRTALGEGDYNDLRLSGDTLATKVQRATKAISDQLSALTLEASMRDMEAATREADEKDAGQLRTRICRDTITVLRLKMQAEGATIDQVLNGDWRDDELTQMRDDLHSDVETALDEEWRIRQSELGDAAQS